MAAILLALAASLAGAGPARAGGTFQVDVGGDIGAPDGCGLLSFSSSVEAIAAQAACGNGQAGLVISGQPAVGAITDGESGSWTISPPAGVSIDQASSPSGGFATGPAIGTPGSAEWAAGLSWIGAGDPNDPTPQEASGYAFLTSGADGMLQTAPDLDASSLSFFLTCEQSTCPDATQVSTDELTISATETAAPTLTPVAGTNLLSVPAGEWIWNPAGDDWPAAISASDPTGVCDLTLARVGAEVSGPSFTPNLSGFQQCPDPTWSPDIDTRAAVPASGTTAVIITGYDAAGNAGSAGATVSVDNVTPTVSIRVPNRSAGASSVSAKVSAAAGPSGVASLSCTIDGRAAALDAAGVLTLTGRGEHTIRCSATNHAVDPQGAHNSGSAQTTVVIADRGTASQTTPIPPASHRRPPALRVRLAQTWSYNPTTSRLRALTVASALPPGTRISFSCRGRGCPRLVAPRARRAAEPISFGASLAAVELQVFRAGDLFNATLSAPGYRTERISARILSGRLPRLAVSG